MNEEALKDAHSLFSNSGYNGDVNEFQTLLSDNAEAFADSYGLFTKSGYSGSEDDYKLLLGLKKKDTSELQEAAAPEGTQDTPSTSEAGQSSLAQKTQDSLDERLSGYKDLSAEDKIAFDKEEELRPFYEAEGVDYDQFLYSNQLEKERKEKESKTRVKQTPEGIQAKRYLESVDENAFQAQKKYQDSKYQSVLSRSTSQEDFLSKVKSEGVDLNYIPLDGLLVDGQKVSYKELERNLYDNDFIDKLQEGGVDVSIKNPEGVESLKYLEDLAQRQIESGGQWGDVAESFLAGGLDLLVAGPLEIIEGIGASVSPAQRAMYMRQGGIMSSKVKEYTEEIRDNIRAYEEQGITKSLIAGNYSDAFFQGSNALAESTPLIMSMAMSSPLLAAKLGPKAAQSITLTGVGASSAGVKSLDLKKMRREGEISISDEALITNMILTGAAEAYFERATLGLINAGRKVIKMNKANPAELADGFVKGLGKSFGIEATSEGLTEVSNVVTDALTEVGTPESFGDFVSQISDAFIIGGLMGGGMHTMPYAFKAISDIGSLREDISAVFTFEDGNTREMKLKEARDFVKDKDIAQRIRNKSIDMDASITENGRNILNEIIYGYYAPDNVAAREGMFVKEKAVQDLVSKIEKADAPTSEDVSSIADALSEMETEGKKNKYNISKSTEATRARVGEFFKDNGIEIVDAVNDQDASMSTITETVESNSIDSVEEYNAVKKQIEDGKRKPTIVKSQDQNGIKIKGENVQKSSITQGKFKSVSSARNAIKEFEIKQEANKNAKPTTDQVAKANNKAFIKTKKEGLDKVPKKVIDSGEYHIISPDRSGITKAELVLRMENTKADLESSGATVYTITEVVDGKSRKSFLVTNTTNAAALGTARNLQVESVFSGKDGILNTDGSVVPLDNSNLSGPEARRAGDISIVNVNGKKTSIYKGVDKSKTTFGKSFDSNNIHKLDESDPNYDKDLLDGVPSDRKRALGFAFKLLSSIGGLKVTVVRNSENMYNQLKALGHPNEEAAQGASSNAFFRGQDKSIYINLENVKGNTLFHEIVHPLVDFMKQNSPETYAKIEKEVSEGKVKRRYIEGGRRMKGTYLEWAQNHPFYSTLSKEAQIEEAFAEMIGDAAYGHFVDRNSRLGRLRALISEILSKIGVTVTDQPEKVSLDDLNLAGITKNLAGALVNGRSINVGGVDFEVGDIEADVAPRFSLDVVDRRSQVQYTYDFNSEAFKEMTDDGTISNDKSIEDFKGKEFIIHSPDAMFSGSIIDKDGTILVEGKGGLLFTFKFNEEGYFWASTDQRAQDMVNLLNSTIEKNGGKIYMALVTAPKDKLLSNTASSRGILNLFTSDNFISKMGMSKPNVYKALVNAANKVQGKGSKAVGLNLNLKSYRPITDFHQDAVEKIWNKLHYDESRFKDRKLFTNTFLQELQKNAFQSEASKTNFINFIKSSLGDDSKVRFNKKGEPVFQSMKGAVVNMLTEPSLRGEEKTNRVYAVLEIDGPVKALKTDSYESYGTSIVSAEGNRAKIHRLDDRKAWYDVFQDPKTGEPIGKTVIGKGEKGNIIYRKDQIMTTVAGVSSMPLKFQAPNVEEVVWEESKIGKGDRAITNRNDAVQKAANDYFAREIEYEEYLKIVKENSLIKPITKFMDPASLDNVKFAIGKKSVSKKTGESMIDVPIEEGREVGVRLDINAYVDKNTWVVTVHDSKVKRDGSLDVGGSPVSYTNVARIKNVTFASNPGAALNIARGKSKATIARIMGNWSPLEGDTPEARAENAKSIIVEVMNDPSWVQVGMNPFRHSYFYDRLDGMPVVKADEVVQIGGLVYAKNAEKVSPLDERFRDPKSGLRFQAPAYEMEYTPNALISLSALSDNNRQPEQWVKEIAKGVKGASRDVDTMGLLELLKAYKKDAKVKSISKEVVESLIATNMAPIETTILDSKPREDDMSLNPAFFEGIEEDSFEAEQMADFTIGDASQTVYGAYTLPGGDNYREFLIHDVSGDDLYKATHYDGLGQNLITSARVDDRVGPNGEKILFVQEIQSDWVQGTNKGDFTNKNEIKELESQRNSLYEEEAKIESEKRKLDNLKASKIDEIANKYSLINNYKKLKKEGNDGSMSAKEYKDIYVDIDVNGSGTIIDSVIEDYENENMAGTMFIKGIQDEISALDDILYPVLEKRKEIIKKLNGLRPNLPWNQTDLWVGLTIRKLINQASKEGYDQIAFVNGDQSNIIQGHSDNQTVYFYNTVVPKNINIELKRLVKGMKYGAVNYGEEAIKIVESGMATSRLDFIEQQAAVSKEKGLGVQAYKSPNAVVNLTPELKAATDKVGPLRFQAPDGVSGEIETGSPFTFTYNKNPEQAPDMGSMFGQDVEPTGDYVTRSEGFTPEGFESGLVTAKKPLVIDITDETQVSYKNDLSDSYDGKTGQELSDAIKEDGFDSIVTLREDGSTGEIILLDDQRSVRFKIEDTDGQTNVYRTGLAAIAWDIGMNVINADYNAGKYITGIKDKDRAYDIRLSTLIGKPFGTHSNEEIKEIMVRSKSELNRQLFRVDQNSKALKKALKNTDYTAEYVDELLHNYDKIKAMEDGDVKKALIEMRKHIDLLSRTLIDEGLVQGQTQFTIDSNMGVYVSRSYKQFQDKGWKQTDNDIIKRVKDFLYKEAKKDNPNATEEELTGIVKLAYRKLKENKDFDYFSSKDSNLAGLSRVNSIFKEKKLIPEEIREFWGEIDNPLYNYSSTVRKMAQDVSAERMYKELMEVGDGKFLSNKQTAEFYNEITGNKWGSLNGKFVDEQMFSVINQIDKKINSEGFGKVQAAYMKLVLFNKKMKTIYNIGTHAKNVIGNTAFAMMNGHINFDAVSVYENGKTAIRAVKTMKDDDVKALYDKLVGLGVVNSSASLQEIRGIAEDLSRSDFDFNDFTSKGTTFSKKVKQAPKKFDNWITELYQKEDDVWKIFGFLAEKGRYIDAGLDVKTAEELAAKNIRNTYPNYDRIPRVIRALGRSPLVGSFVAFQAEAVRNVKNTIQLGFQEVSSDNPKIRAIGAQRIAGTVVTSTLMGSLQIQTAQLLAQSLGFLSEDEETSESKLIRILMPIWDATGNLVVWNRGNLDTKQFKGQSTPDRYFDYINFSSTSGIGYIKDVFRLAFTDIDTVAGKESVLRVAEKIYEPFLGKEMTAGIVQEALANRNSKIFKETDSNLEKVWSIISYVGNKVQPGITKSGARITKAALDMEKDLVTGYEVLALLGIRISRINVNKNLSYKGYFINKEMVESVGREAMKDESTVRARAREDKDFDNRLNQLADVISSASYQGLSGEDIRNILRYKGDESTRSGLSEAVIMEAYNRHLLRYDPDVINVE